MGRYAKNISEEEKQRLIAEKKQERNRRYYATHRSQVCNYMKRYHMERVGQQALGTTNFSKHSSVEAEIKKLGLSNYFLACRAKSKADISYAKACIRRWTARPQVAETNNNGVWSDEDMVDPNVDENGDDVEEE
jgi:hypothetical protein